MPRSPPAKPVIDQPVVIERRAGDGVTELPILRLNRPHDLAGLLIERDQFPVELAEKHLAVTEPESATDP